jgi:hypothetical protein
VVLHKQGRFADMIPYVGQKASRGWHEACQRDGALCKCGKLKRLCRNGTVYMNVSRRRLSHRFSRTNHLIINLSSIKSPLFFAFNNMHSTILYQPPSKLLLSVNTLNCIQRATRRRLLHLQFRIIHKSINSVIFQLFWT